MGQWYYYCTKHWFREAKWPFKTDFHYLPHDYYMYLIISGKHSYSSLSFRQHFIAFWMWDWACHCCQLQLSPFTRLDNGLEKMGMENNIYSVKLHEWELNMIKYFI